MEIDRILKMIQQAKPLIVGWFGNWVDWVPTQTGFSSAPVGGIYRYCLTGKKLEFIIRQPNAGTSGAGFLTISAPFTAKVLTGAMWMFPAALENNGIIQTAWGRGRIGSGESVFTFGLNPAIDGGFTHSGNKRVSVFSGFYEIE